MALSIDRQAFVDIIGQGQGRIGGVLQPPPAGLWGMPPETLRELPGYDPDVQKNRTEGRRVMEGLGYSPDHRLSIKITSQDLADLPGPGGAIDRSIEAGLHRQ